MANPTITPIMTPASGPGGVTANPTYLVDQYGNPFTPTNPMITADEIRALIIAGQGFRVTTTQLASGGAAVAGVQGVTNAIAINIFVYSITMVVNTGQSDNRLYINPGSVSTDAGLTTNLLTTTVNQNPGSTRTSLFSALNGSPAVPSAGAVSNAGTQVATFGIAGNTMQQFLQNGSGIWLPKGTQNTFAAYAILAGANKCAITVEWVEL